MIKPTVGRVVLVKFDSEQKEPIPALICKVHSDTLINVAGFTESGRVFNYVDIQLLQDSDEPEQYTPFAYWMDYQKKVAAEHAAEVK